MFKKAMTKKNLLLVCLLAACTSMLLCACVPNGSPDDKIFEELIDVSKEESQEENTGVLAESDFLTIINVVSITPNDIAVCGVLKEAAVQAGVDRVRVSGGMNIDQTEAVRDGYFIVPVTLPENTRMTLTASPMKGEEEVDETLSFSAPYDATAEERLDGKSVAVGSDSRLFFSNALGNFTGEEIYTASGVKSIKAGVVSQYRAYESLVDGAKFGLIYVLIPDAAAVDPSILSERLEDTDGQFLTRYQQVLEAVSATKANVVDMRAILKAELEAGTPMNELFRITDSHLTEYASILMYQEVMKIIAAKYPQTEYRTVEDFDVAEKTVRGGDYVLFRGLDPEVFTETIKLYTPKKAYGDGVSDIILYNDSVNNDYSLFTTIDAKDGKTSAAERSLVNNENTDLPNALIYRGENGMFASKLIADSLNQTLLARVGDYFISMTDAKTYRNKTAEKKATDFIIVFVSENDIAAAFGE